MTTHLPLSKTQVSYGVQKLMSYITVRLAPLRSWMRMRVHFGHVNVVAYNKKKIESSGFNFDSLEELMGHSRTICNFDRRYVK